MSQQNQKGWRCGQANGCVSLQWVQLPQSFVDSTSPICWKYSPSLGVSMGHPGLADSPKHSQGHKEELLASRFQLHIQSS